MKIKNLTSVPQSLEIFELSGDRGFTIYIEGNGSTEIEGAYIPNIERLSRVFQVDGVYIPNHIKESCRVIQTEGSQDSGMIDTHTEESPSSSEEIHEEKDITEDRFICDICGSEFASARGLNSHKNRAHSAE